MKYLNLGCGMHYAKGGKWTNVDFESNDPAVIGHNLLNGIPFEDESFDFVYHSHVLEHFAKKDGKIFLKECMRVLKPGGIIRVVVPDLERIVREYLKWLEQGLESPDDVQIRANYEWITLEMFDQTVRNISGGDMKGYIYQDEIPNEDYVFERIGEEGRAIRNIYLTSVSVPEVKSEPSKGLVPTLKAKIRAYLIKRLQIDTKAHEIGQFRLGGQIHQWMYDRYSLFQILKDSGAGSIIQRDTFSSYLPDWESYSLDGKRPTIRKPDSLYLEAIKL